MAYECGCAKWRSCRRNAVDGSIWHQGRHRTPQDVLEYILKQSCWRGAKVERSGDAVLVRKGSAEMRLAIPVAYERPAPEIATMHGKTIAELTASYVAAPNGDKSRDLVAEGEDAMEAAILAELCAEVEASRAAA